MLLWDFKKCKIGFKYLHMQWYERIKNHDNHSMSYSEAIKNTKEDFQMGINR